MAITFPTADARLDWVREKLANDPVWIVKALLDTFARQTHDEQNDETTRHENGVGFGGRDVEILSSFAKQVIRWNQTPERLRTTRFPLSDKQLNLARRLMPKYANQLIRAHSAEFDAKFPVLKKPRNSPNAATSPARSVAEAIDRTRAFRAEHAQPAPQPGYSSDEIDMAGRPKFASDPDRATF